MKCGLKLKNLLARTICTENHTIARRGDVYETRIGRG